MAGPWYVRSLAAGTADGLSWANAKTTLAAAATASSAGDTIWVADDHAETQASALSVTFPGTMSNPNFVYCADRTVASPGTGDLKTTATITTTGANTISVFGSAYVYGVTLNCGTGAVSSIITLMTAPGYQRWENCAINKNGTTQNGSAISLGGTSSYIEFINTTVKFGATNDAIRALSNFTWKNTPSAIQGATLPTSLFNAANSVGMILLEGLDLSALGSGNTIFSSSNLAGGYFVKDCKLGASVTVAATPSSPGYAIFTSRSDSGATNYRSEKYGFTGTQVVETSIVRTGGASDGTTPISWKLTTTSAAKFVLPFDAMPIAIWNDKITGTLTVSVEGIWSGGAPGLPNNDDIWMEVEYLGSALTPLGSYISGTKANNLATGAAQTASTATWAASPATPTKFKMVSAFTAPAMKGPVYVTIKCGKALTTFYVDPAVTLS